MNYPTQSMEELCQCFYKAIKDGDDETASEIILSLKFYEVKCFNKLYASIVKNDEKEKKYYMITYTIKENLYDKNIDYLSFVKEDLLRPSLKLTQIYVVKEHTKKNVPHYHCAVETTRYLKKELFKYMSKKLGFVDCSKSNSNNIMEMLNYMSKESTPIKLL